MLEVCQATLVIINNIPNEFEQFKITVQQRRHLVEQVCDKIIKLEEYFINVKKIKSNKAKKGGSKSKEKEKDEPEVSIKKETKIKGLHIIKNELEFAVQVTAFIIPLH